MTDTLAFGQRLPRLALTVFNLIRRDFLARAQIFLHDHVID